MAMLEDYGKKQKDCAIRGNPARAIDKQKKQPHTDDFHPFNPRKLQ